MKDILAAVSPYGRTDRIGYLVWLFFGFMLVLPGVGISLLMNSGDIVLAPFQLTPASVAVNGILAIPIILALVGLVMMQMAAVRRCHDIGWSGWWSLPLVIAPLLALAMGDARITDIVSWPIRILLLFAPGQQLANRFGEPPPRTEDRGETPATA